MDPTVESSKKAFYSSNLHARPNSGLQEKNTEHNLEKAEKAIQPDRLYLASGSWDKTIKIWDVEAGKEVLTLAGHSECIRDLIVLPNGFLASSSEDSTIKIWNWTEGKEIKTLKGHSASVTSLAVLANGRLVSGSRDRTVKIWDCDTGKEVFSFNQGGMVLSLAVLRNGHVAVGTDDKTISIRNPEDGAMIGNLEGFYFGRYKLTEQAKSEGSIPNIKIPGLKSRPLLGKDALAVQIFSLLQLPDGRLASGSSDTTIMIWSCEPGHPMVIHSTLSGHKCNVFDLAILPNGNLASCSSDSTIKIWDTANLKEIRTLPMASHVNSVRCLPNGHLVAATHANDIKILDPEEGVEIRTLEGHTSSVESLAVLSFQ